MRVIVCGGRDYSDVKRVHVELDALGITALAEGGNRKYRITPSGARVIDWTVSADAIAHRWARLRGLKPKTFEAKWSIYRHAAGPIRNRLMLVDFKPDAVVAFPGGHGTADMVEQARAAGVRVIEIAPETTTNPQEG